MDSEVRRNLLVIQEVDRMELELKSIWEGVSEFEKRRNKAAWYRMEKIRRMITRIREFYESYQLGPSDEDPRLKW